MFHCDRCRGRIRGEREKVGARCPHCQQPLYERQREPGRRDPLAEGSHCPVHGGNDALAPCQRCGTFMFRVCRTRWNGRVVCAACVERALTRKDERPGAARAHFRQAVLGLILGIVAWVGPCIVIPVAIFLGAVGIGMLGNLLIFACLVSGIFGMGQAAAALRARGAHMVMATIGFILSGLQVGVIVGVFSILIWTI